MTVVCVFFCFIFDFRFALRFEAGFRAQLDRILHSPPLLPCQREGSREILEGAEPDDLELEELDLLEEFEKEIIEEVDIDETGEDLNALEKISWLEDRSKVQEEVEALQAKCVEERDASKAAASLADDSGVSHAPSSKQVIFSSILAQFESAPIFDLTQDAAQGKHACLQRMAAMKPHLLDFIRPVKIAEGFLVQTQVCDEKPPQKKQWNEMMSELSRAKQYARFRGLRSSRMASWMGAQEDLHSHAAEKGLQEEECSEGLQKIDVFRPLSSPSAQFIIYKSDGPMVEYQLGMVLSIYRGSVSKNKTTDRRMTISKPLPTAAPASLAAKLRVVQMEKLESTTMLARHWCQWRMFVVRSQHWKKESRMVSSTTKIPPGLFGHFDGFAEQYPHLWQGVAEEQEEEEEHGEEEFQGFNYKSFVKGDAGDANIENLGFCMFLYVLVCVVMLCFYDYFRLECLKDVLGKCEVPEQTWPISDHL